MTVARGEALDVCAREATVGRARAMSRVRFLAMQYEDSARSMLQRNQELAPYVSLVVSNVCVGCFKHALRVQCAALILRACLNAAAAADAEPCMSFASAADLRTRSCSTCARGTQRWARGLSEAGLKPRL
eukprot:754873-Pleurochrysis_carterae.AAC.2